MHVPPIVFRKDSWDEDIWNSVRHGNEYGIKGMFGGCVVDVGAHIGAFCSLAESFGARRIIAVEPDEDNFDLLRFNCKHLLNDGRLAVHNKAISTHEGVRFSKAHDTWPNTGGALYVPNLTGAVEGITLDKLIAEVDMPILLKLDCEGAEFGALRASQLKNVVSIVGEFHGVVDGIRADLIAKGFAFSSHQTGERIGLFGANRTL